MKIDALKPGMTVFDVHKAKAGNTSLRRWGVWTVTIVSVEGMSGTVFASWNGNPPRRFYEKSIRKWKKEAPHMVGDGLSRRPETRLEKIARLRGEG